MHFSEGGYDRIAIKLFNEINVDCYYVSSALMNSNIAVHDTCFLLSQLEYDTERAGTFEPLKFVPKEKTIVLGLISSKLPQVHFTCTIIIFFHLHAYNHRD